MNPKAVKVPKNAGSGRQRYVFIVAPCKYESMTVTVTVGKEALKDLLRVKDEFDTIVESLELMADEEFMNSYQKAKEQIKKREFVDWNAL